MNSPDALVMFEMSLEAGLLRTCCEAQISHIFSRDVVHVTEARIIRRAQLAFDADAEAHWHFMRQSP